MTLSTGQRCHHFKNTIPKDPAITPFAAWPTPNLYFDEDGASPGSVLTENDSRATTSRWKSHSAWTVLSKVLMLGMTFL